METTLDPVTTVDANASGVEGFEGPEKNLEVDFVPGKGPEQGLRALTRQDWDQVLDLAKCQILSTLSNSYCDSYVLSESSLFVYKSKCVLKTCGTTTLLRCLSLLLDKARALGMELEWVGYSRKNYTFPEHQVFPHTSFTQEVNYTKDCMDPRGEPLHGGAHVLGDLTSDHWYLYVADYFERKFTAQDAESTINIMMYGLDPEVTKMFYRDPNPDSISPKDDARRATEKSGISKLVSGAEVDDYMFEPCGYSMNALMFDTYYTMHITPENGFSYASFETNLRCNDYRSLLRNVLQAFRPQRFSVTVFADEARLKTMNSLPVDAAVVPLKLQTNSEASKKESGIVGYKKLSHSMARFTTDYVCHLGNYVALTSQNKMLDVAAAAAADEEEAERVASAVSSATSPSPFDREDLKDKFADLLSSRNVGYDAYQDCDPTDMDRQSALAAAMFGRSV